MTPRQAAELRNRAARLLLAAHGEELPEQDAGASGVARGLLAPVGQPAAEKVAVSIVQALTADERTIYDVLMAQLAPSAINTIDLTEHCALIARNNARVKLCAAEGRH